MKPSWPGKQTMAETVVQALKALPGTTRVVV